MVISMEEYALLRQEFLKVAKFHITTEILNQLKKEYKAVINSARTLDCIPDIENLIRTLEKRGAIRYNNITPLRHIAKKHLSHSTIIQKLDHYEAWLKSYIPPYPPHTNLYKAENVHYNPEPSAPYFAQEVHIGYAGASSNTATIYDPPFHPNTYALHNATPPILPPLQILGERETRLQNKVFEVVSMKLGNHWRDVARCLDIRECDINDIESRYQQQQEKALAALKLFARETDLDYWQRTLKTALEKARRKDLKEEVEELISRRF